MAEIEAGMEQLAQAKARQVMGFYRPGS